MIVYRIAIDLPSFFSCFTKSSYNISRRKNCVSLDSSPPTRGGFPLDNIMKQYWHVLNHGWFMFTVPGEHKSVRLCKNRTTAKFYSFLYCVIRFPNLHTASPSCIITKEEIAQLKQVITVNTR